MSNIDELVQRETKERPAHVRFERIAVEDVAASRASGHYVAMDVDFVTVTPVGGGGNGVKFKIKAWRDNMKRDVEAGRIPRQWVDTYEEMYKRWQSGQDIPLNGVPIRGWPVISPAQQEILIARTIMTVEDLAALNAEGVQRIGMGGTELKNKAQAWLQAARDTGPIVQENAALKRDMAMLKANNEDLTNKVNELLAAVKARGESAPVFSDPAPSNDSEISAADILDDEVTDLAEQYTKKFGQPPHHRMKPETIRRALSE